MKKTNGYDMSLKCVYACVHMYEFTGPKISNKLMHIRCDYITSWKQKYYVGVCLIICFAAKTRSTNYVV